jgi:hypothetical protein
VLQGPGYLPEESIPSTQDFLLNRLVAARAKESFTSFKSINYFAFQFCKIPFSDCLKNQTEFSFFDGTPVHYTDTGSRTRIYLGQLLRLQPKGKVTHSMNQI